MAFWVIPADLEIVEVDIQQSPLDRPRKLSAEAHLGFGLLHPFVRDQKNDFANDGGERLVKACVGQVLGTRASSDTAQGEIPWNTEFGSLLYRLKHMKNDFALQDIVRVYVVDALKRWEPRVIVKQVTMTRESTDDGGENILAIRLRYDVITRNAPGNEVLLSDVSQTVRV